MTPTYRSFALPGYEDMEISTQILIRNALQRGIEVEVLDRRHNFIRLSKDDHVEYVKQATKTALDSYMSFLIMENKTVTKRVLRENGFNVPRGRDFSNLEQAASYARTLRERGCVVKPATSNFGEGISLFGLKATDKELTEAVEKALNYSATVVVEELIPGNECRFLVLGDSCPAVCMRVPANVVGDGEHTVEDLVAEKNADPRRGFGHKTPLEKISLGEVELGVLSETGYDPSSVPMPRERVLLRRNSNVSTGGDSLDITDETASFYKDIAIRGAQSVGAKICGVDIILENHREEGPYTILELNFNPVLYIHNYPFKGQNREVGQHVLNLLGF